MLLEFPVSSRTKVICFIHSLSQRKQGQHLFTESPPPQPVLHKFQAGPQILPSILSS